VLVDDVRSGQQPAKQVPTMHSLLGGVQPLGSNASPVEDDGA